MPEPQEQLDQDLEVLELVLAARVATASSITVLRLDEIINTMIQSGMSKESIREVLVSDLLEGGRIFGEYRNAIKNTTGQAITNASSQAEKFVYNKEGIERFRWITAGNNVCPDCEDRAGGVESFKFWELAGLPRSGFSVCGANCNCRIVPESYTEKKITEIKRRAERKKELERKFKR